MREEVKLWWKQALKDLEAAEKNYEMELYYVSAFLIQQSLEKALKALYIFKLKTSPGTTHSLIFLGNSVKMPEKFKTYLRKITPDFVITRYPYALGELPSDLYDKETLKEKLRMAKEVLKWIKKELNL